MKILKKTSVIIMLVLVMLFATQANAVGLPEEALSNTTATDFVMTFVRQPEHSTYGTWSTTTSVGNRIDLYDAGGNITGAIFDLVTDSMPSGYVEIVFLAQGPVVKAYSYNGINAVAGLSNHLDTTLNPYDQNIKVISLGGLNYVVQDMTNPEVVFDLSSGNQMVFDKEFLQLRCEEQLSNMSLEIEQELMEARSQVLPASTNAFEYVGGLSAFDLVKIADFTGYHDHCAPTAGTNVIKYYHDVWGINFYDSRDYTFELLYDLMGTTTGGGTPPSGMINAMRPYFNYYGITYDYSGTTTSPSLSLIRSYINRDCPVIMNVSNLDGTVGAHSIVAYGCNPGSSVVVSTGWDYALHTYTYSLLTVNRLIYIGFDFA